MVCRVKAARQKYEVRPRSLFKPWLLRPGRKSKDLNMGFIQYTKESQQV